MTSLLTPPDHAASAYDSLAPYYDKFTAAYAHEAWIEAIESRARSFGLRGNRALDIGCGTGKSTAPLLERGYRAVGCDISEEMVERARRNLPAHAGAFRVADMRSLPYLGEFDLVVCLDDTVNYLLNDEELDATFAAVTAMLAPAGVFAFDVNSLATYRSSFAQAMVREIDGLFFSWRGEQVHDIAPGDLAAATVEVFAQRLDGLWERRSSRHTQRHHTPAAIRGALARSGLACCAVLGQLAGAQLESEFDEERHIKLLYFAHRADAIKTEGR